MTSPEARAGANELMRALALFLIALIAACFLRLPDRAAKPMHTDEATQALKLKELMEGTYRYDPVDHHGPTLLYSTVPVKWFSSARTWKDLNESTLRLTPALYGIGLLFLLFLVRDGFTPLQLAWGSLAVAVSPVMVFYSRYFIMEMLLVFFTFALIGCGWRYYITRRAGWLAGAGVSAGLMHGTKETCVLHFAAIALSIGLVALVDLFSAGSGMGVVNRNRKNPINRRQFVVFLVAAAVTSVVVFSQFFTKWDGVWNSVATYFRMIGRAGGEGHEKPFLYYWGLLWGGSLAESAAATGFKFSRLPEILGFKPGARMVTGERLLLALGLIGVVAAFFQRPARNQSQHLARFMACYAVLTFLIYSLIAYKTPWCVLGAWHGMLIMAGVGVRTIITLFESRAGRVTAASLLCLGLAHSGLLAWRLSRGPGDKPGVAVGFAADARNPFNYSMTSRDCLQWVERLHRFAEIDPKGWNLSIVQADRFGGWPLPWYLERRFPNYVWRGGDVSLLDSADVILAGEAERSLLPEHVTQPGVTDAAHQNWVRFPLTLHTSGRLTIYIRRELWEKYVSRQPWPPLPVQS